MVEIASRLNTTLAAIDRGIVETEGEAYHSHGIPISQLAGKCLRKIWYAFRRVYEAEKFDAQAYRIFESGRIYEERVVSWLQRAGFDVGEVDPQTGKQFKVILAGGWLRGQLDAKVTGIPEAPITTHACEIKSANKKWFDEICKKGVKEAKPEHYLQVQLYAHKLGLKRCLYICVCKNDDAIHIERFDYDPELCMQKEAIAEHVALSENPPPRLHENPESPMAKKDCHFCDFKKICHRGGFPKSHNCRTCAFSRPVSDGKHGTWHCDMHDHPLSWDEAKAGCGQHLFLSELIPGEFVDYDEQKHQTSYRLKDGTIWVDGQSE